MNRSILIVICDFLLLSLLAFSSPDINNITDDRGRQDLKFEIATNQAAVDKDMTAAMRVALDEERKHRDQLLGELSHSREEAARQQALLADQQSLLANREKQVQTFQQQLQVRNEQAKQLEQQQTALQEQYNAAQTNLQNLGQQLHSSSVEALLSKEKLAAMEADMRKQTAQASALQQQMEQLARSNQMVLNEKQQLATQLQVAQVERRSASEMAARMQEEVKVEREEKARLAEGVKVLASKSSELAREVRDNRPLAPNAIFSDFLTNRVQAQFDALRSGLLGEANKHKDTETILVSDGTNTFALCHIQDTPLTLWNPGTEWEGLSGTLSHNGAALPIRSVSFCWPDPRVLLIPLTKNEAAKMGCKIYRISADPYKFQDAVLVGARDGYYGQCRFEIDTSTPDYVKLDRNFLKGLFGKFNPSRGDLVFSVQGELLGIMANDSYCLMLKKFDSAASFNFGADIRQQHTGDTLAKLYSFVSALPFRLQ